MLNQKLPTLVNKTTKSLVQPIDPQDMRQWEDTMSMEEMPTVIGTELEVEDHRGFTTRDSTAAIKTGLETIELHFSETDFMSMFA